MEYQGLLVNVVVGLDIGSRTTEQVIDAIFLDQLKPPEPG